MSIDEIKQYAINYRTAIDSAKKNGRFKMHQMFNCFPKRSCLLASELLAEYLQGLGVDTLIIQGSGSFEDGTHSWLAINDIGYRPDQVNEQYSEEAYAALQLYNPDPCISQNVVRNVYDTSLIWQLNIIDITIDQFGPQYHAPYVGKPLNLHRQFEIRPDVYNGNYDSSLYSTIASFL